MCFHIISFYPEPFPCSFPIKIRTRYTDRCCAPTLLCSFCLLRTAFFRYIFPLWLFCYFALNPQTGAALRRCFAASVCGLWASLPIQISNFSPLQINLLGEDFDICARKNAINIIPTKKTKVNRIGTGLRKSSDTISIQKPALRRFLFREERWFLSHRYSDF